MTNDNGSERANHYFVFSTEFINGEKTEKLIDAVHCTCDEYAEEVANVRNPQESGFLSVRIANESELPLWWEVRKGRQLKGSGGTFPVIEGKLS